ncbi:MAG TPA: CoA-transferase [Fimbriimonadaceae bacterium]|nr:CoA-transferase [Fimbriimonadaceae bacterium]
MPNKVSDLRTAIDSTVRPGMALHFALSQSRANAAIRELLRMYSGSTPEFTLSSTGFGGPQLGLFPLALGLASRLVTGFVGNQYPSPGPCRVVNAKIDDGTIELEPWSLLSFLQRLGAAARGEDWAPTRSLDGSSLANSENVRATSEGTFVRAFRPDVTFLHGVVADEDGNTVLSTPIGEGTVGAAAARLGAIVTVERIVSRSDLCALAGAPMLPGSHVLAVCESRYGAHPSGVFAGPTLTDLSYSDDYDFIVETFDALRLPKEELDAWVESRLLTTETDHDRMAQLEAAAHSPVYRGVEASRSPGVVPTDEELMIVVAARAIATIVDGNNVPKHVLAGIGSSSLAAWLAKAQASHFPPLISEVGFYDYDPVRGNPFLFYFPNLKTTAGLTSTEEILGNLVQGQGSDSLGVLAAGQIDRAGNTNSSRIDGRWLTGSGGANDVASGARRNLVLIPHRPGRLVDSVEYVTSPGRNVVAIATNLGLLERAEDGEFELTKIIPEPDWGTAVETARASTPWPLRVSENLRAWEPPSSDELETLHSFDPDGFFLGR